MQKYFYTARDQNGKIVTGELEASGENFVVNVLQEHGLFVVSVSEFTDAKPRELRKGRKQHRNIKLSDYISFCRELSTLLKSGVPLLRSLNIIHKQISSARLFSILSDIIKDVQSGSTLKDAFEKHPRYFSKLWINLVSTGEASANLPQTLEELARYLESREKINQKVGSAVVYPAVLLIVVIASLLIFTMKIIPVFEDIFNDFNANLPILTTLIIWLSNVVRSFFLYIVFAIGAALYAANKFFKTRPGKKMLDAFLLNVPVLKIYIIDFIMSKIASTLSILIRSGVPILHALDLTGKSSGNVIIEKVFEDIKLEVKRGQSLARLFEEKEIFPPMVVQMIAIGEEIGELGKMLEHVSAYYYEKMTVAIDRLLVLIEPVLLIVIGGVVGIMVVAMFLPIFNLASAVRA